MSGEGDGVVLEPRPAALAAVAASWRDPVSQACYCVSAAQFDLAFPGTAIAFTCALDAGDWSGCVPVKPTWP